MLGKVIIGYDADGAGQTATIWGMEILQNLGCDIRILQLDKDAKDPDEYVVKYGTARFEKCVENAISLVEFKVKILKQTIKTNSTSDKIKFLNEIVKILSKVDNNIEREIYINKISNEYGISKEAIYGESNKLAYADSKGIKELQKPIIKTKIQKYDNETLSQNLIKRENMIISILINPEINAYEEINSKIKPEDFKLEYNKQIAKKLYEHYKSGDSNNNILDLFNENKDLINHITSIMADDFEIIDNNKVIEDLVSKYEKDRLTDEKNQIIKQLENKNLSQEETKQLENNLNKLIIQISKMK